MPLGMELGLSPGDFVLVVLLALSVSEEMNAQWDIPLHVDTSLAAFVRGVLPATDSSSAGSNSRSDGGGGQMSAERRRHSGDSRHPSGTTAVSTILPLLSHVSPADDGEPAYKQQCVFPRESGSVDYEKMMGNQHTRSSASSLGSPVVLIMRR